jgi:hypothetical protein
MAGRCHCRHSFRRFDLSLVSSSGRTQIQRNERRPDRRLSLQPGCEDSLNSHDDLLLRHQDRGDPHDPVFNTKRIAGGAAGFPGGPREKNVLGLVPEKYAAIAAALAGKRGSEGTSRPEPPGAARNTAAAYFFFELSASSSSMCSRKAVSWSSKNFTWF